MTLDLCRFWITARACSLPLRGIPVSSRLHGLRRGWAAGSTAAGPSHRPPHGALSCTCLSIQPHSWGRIGTLCRSLCWQLRVPPGGCWSSGRPALRKLLPACAWLPCWAGPAFQTCSQVLPCSQAAEVVHLRLCHPESRAQQHGSMPSPWVMCKNADQAACPIGKQRVLFLD